MSQRRVFLKSHKLLYCIVRLSFRTNSSLQSRSLNLNPLYLMIPATLSCSYAFMLPVATPPNAIVYTASGMSTSVMVRGAKERMGNCRQTLRLPNLQIKCGFFVNIFCVATNFLCLNTYGSLIYGLDDNDPDWLL